MSGGVRKLASVVVGAVVGFAQGGPWGAVAGAALAFYASEQQEKLNTKSPLRDNEPSAQTVRSSKAPVRFILGRVSTGGVLVWAQEQAGAQGEGEWLHLVYVLCEGPITALENIYLGEEEIGSYGAQATYELVVNPTQVNAFLKANCPDWKDSQIGRGLSFVRVSLQYSAEKFPSGIPDTRFVVRGRNDVYDPRTGTAVYSANTALHLLWFLRARCGVPDDEIVFETFASAANVCDEALTNADGSTSQRYRSGCVIGADEQRTGVLQKLEAACGGHLIRVGGRWMLQAGAYYGPYDFEITEDMVIGTVSGSTEPTNDSAINTVRGTFIDPSQSWTETDYPEVSVAQWIVEDGGEAAETLTYSYVTDPYQAQRLANMELRRRRAGGAISIPMNFAGYNCRPGRVVRVNLPSLNILGEFIVSDWSMGDSEGCTVQVKQYEAAIFDDAVGQPYNPIGFINLPAGGLGTPSSLTWTQDTTAEVTQGVLSWLPPTGIVKEYIVIVRQGANAVQSHNVPATSTEIAINGLPSGNYTMSVAAVGPMARSGEVTITVSINGPPIPESCVVQSSIDSIVLIPSNSQNGLNGGTYEYFFSTSPTATAADADYLGQGLSFTHTGLGFWTNYYYFIRSSNAYGKSAFLYVPAQTSNDVSAYLAALAGKISKTELGQDVVTEIEKIPGLQAQIDALDNILLYDPQKTYLKNDMVQQGQRLYQAVQAVPLNTPPPNQAYWKDVGQSIEAVNGVAQQVATNTTDINELDGVVTATATSLEALRASSRDDNGEGDLADALKGWNSTAAIATESKVRASATEAMAQRQTTLEARVGQNESTITDLDRVVTTTNTANATKINQLGVSVGQNTADIQQTSAAYADTAGKLTTMWSVKMQVNAQGQYVAAGIGLGIENTGAGLQSQFLVAADRFAVVNGINGNLSVPFAVQGGQVFMNSAFIMDGAITNAKIGNYISSTNYIAGQQGWILNKDGTLEINGIVPGQGRLVINSLNVSVYDANNVLRVRLGWLG
ncbi:host specificity protein J [Pseudomonas koreensis]|nr:host specificity protein J [Pseudomonas koreensis]